ncbi:hypothetical protein F2Q68_00040093 [Brassica cretica]|uniref:Uncharacterized protein n=1 Tax=Brassica cretica TaxID=69181 RepID=A0A8S9MU05_BRACR|nr:hypothetical protein F2Q68_00040093 [Brassica cretica]
MEQFEPGAYVTYALHKDGGGSLEELVSVNGDVRSIRLKNGKVASKIGYLRGIAIMSAVCKTDWRTKEHWNVISVDPSHSK